MANKHIEMLQTFYKVMKKDTYYINLVIPNMYKKNIYEIDYKELKKNNINNLIFDIDNTILKVDDTFVPKKLIGLFNKLKKEGFNICIVSNNGINRTKTPAEKLEVKFISNAKKPKKEAFDKALEILDSKINNTAMIGDQMLSDIRGANAYGLYTILVDPLENKYNLQTKVSRVLQNKMEKKLQKEKRFIKGKYY